MQPQITCSKYGRLAHAYPDYQHLGELINWRILLTVPAKIPKIIFAGSFLIMEGHMY